MATNKSNFLQVCWVVDDLARAIDNWMRCGNVGPFFVFRHPVIIDYRYGGTQPGKLDMSVALAQAGPMQIELIQQHDDAPSAYRDVYACGQSGMHHVCGFVPDYDAEMERYRSAGVRVAHSGVAGTMRFAYMDTRAQLGCMTEVLQESAEMRELFRVIADAAVGWDGSNPIREM